MAIDQSDTPDLQLRKRENAINHLVGVIREAHLEYLDSLFVVLWGNIAKPTTSADLLSLGFDDSKEPQEQDYWEHM